MDIAQDEIKTGFMYGPRLAGLLGLPDEQATDVAEPLLGAAVELRVGAKGRHLCVLHVFVDAAAPLRLPAAQSLSNLQSRRDVAPYLFMRKAAKSIRGALSQRMLALSNLALLRMAKSPVSAATTVNQDAEGAYSSLPLDGYERDFVPGVTWLAMSFNCAALEGKDYTRYSLWLERSDGPEQMILNLKVDPAQMLELQLPARLFDGMRPAIDRAMQVDDARPPAPPEAPYQIISGEG